MEGKRNRREEKWMERERRVKKVEEKTSSMCYKVRGKGRWRRRRKISWKLNLTTQSVVVKFNLAEHTSEITEEIEIEWEL